MKKLSKIALLNLALFTTIIHADNHPWTSQYKTQHRIFIHYSERNTTPGSASFKDNNYANMRLLGFTQKDVDTLENECKAYFLEYYGIDFSNIKPLPDGSLMLPDSSALMFPEKIPEVQDARVVLDTENTDRNNSAKQSYVVQDTGCALSILKAGTGVYGGINQGMPRAANDLIIYGYANIFDPHKPLNKAHLLERIKFKPAWPIKAVPVANSQGLSLIEAVFKIEAEYTDKNGVVHEGIGISGFSQRFDKNGVFYQSKRTVYSFPE
ncbi:MAG: hypothetical protein H0U73_03895 [Tatlockia sp.]|nr:hypothetical protein [Tatlockia sp.]